ncbi:MAG: acetylglutamate kinase [Saprospiraceae bacterium]
MRKLSIIKIGGKLLDSPDQLSEVLSSFSKIPDPKILVHGGGKRSTELSEQLGIIPQLVDGRRITDARTLELVVMVYAGLLNKTVVGQLQSFGCDAIGLSGADGNSILAKKRKVGPINFGFAGDIKKIYTPFIENLLGDGLTPVFCAITHNGKGQLLNTNADTIATSLAVALSEKFAVTLQFVFEKSGVLSDPKDDNSALHKLSKNEYGQLKKTGAISEGMIPKLDNAFLAKKGKVDQVFVGGTTSIDQENAFKGTEICT